MSKKFSIKIVILAISAIAFVSFSSCRKKEEKTKTPKPAAEAEQGATPNENRQKKSKENRRKNSSQRQKKRTHDKKKQTHDKNTQTNRVESAEKRKPRPVIDMLPATSVVVRINGEDVTKRDFVMLERVYVKMFAMANKWSPSTVNDDTRKFKHNNRVQVLDDLMTFALISQYAHAEGIEADAAGIVAKEREFLKKVNKPKAKFADVAASFGSAEGEMLNKVMVQGAAVTMAALVHSTTNDLYHVTEQEFTNRLVHVEKVNRDADASNAVVRARALQAKKEIQAGAFFADVAKKYADFSPEQGNEWDTVELSEFDGDSPLGQWLARSDTGDISEPLILDDGVSIVGIKAKYESDLSESNKPPVYVYDIVRCAFHDYDKLDDFDGDRESIVEDMIRLRRQAAMQALLTKLKEKAKFEFPSGQNLFYPPEKKKSKKADKKKAGSEPKPDTDKKADTEKKAEPNKKAGSEPKPGADKKADTEKKAEPAKKVDAEKKAEPAKKVDAEKSVETGNKTESEKK